MVKPSQSLPSPRIDSARVRDIHKLCTHAELMQWRSAERIRSAQLKSVRLLLLQAQRYSAFYARQFSGLDVEHFDWQQFSELPILRRSQLLELGTQLDSAVIPEAHGKTSSTMTSGSTGAPVEVRTSEWVAAVWAANAMRDHLWHERDAKLTMAAIRWQVENVAMAPEGAELSSWGEPHNFFYDTGKGYFLNSSSSVKEQLHWLERRDPHYLITHPSNLQALIILGELRGISLSNLQQIRTVGESVSQELRNMTRSVLNTPLIDFYSSQELGYLALQCPQHEHYHVLSDSVILEVVDDDGKPCEPGVAGRILVTSLHNYITPLIRYEIGDYGVLGDACSCGRGLPVLQEILGRRRNMVSFPDGNKKWPNLGFREMMTVADIKQFQVVQVETDRLELRLVLDTTLPTEKEVALKEILRRYLGFPFVIGITYHDSIPRSASGKYEDFMSLLQG